MITGTIIHGTLRMQDLIPAFAEFLAEHSDNFPGWTDEWNNFITVDGDEIIFNWPDDDDSVWYSDAAMWLMDDLFDMMNELAPEGYYFGAHPGDGSDFGYWPIELL